MARNKNALTEYYIGKLDGEEADLKLDKWIREVTDDSDEVIEDEAFYDGDGTPVEDVVSVKKKYTFEGFFDEEEKSHALIADLEFETGEARKVLFKQVRTNGDTLVGTATVTEPKITGGAADDYATLEFGIAWDTKPEITPAT